MFNFDNEFWQLIKDTNSIVRIYTEAYYTQEMDMSTESPIVGLNFEIQCNYFVGKGSESGKYAVTGGCLTDDYPNLDDLVRVKDELKKALRIKNIIHALDGLEEGAVSLELPIG